MEYVTLNNELKCPVAGIGTFIWVRGIYQTGVPGIYVRNDQVRFL